MFIPDLVFSPSRILEPDPGSRGPKSTGSATLLVGYGNVLIGTRRGVLMFRPNIDIVVAEIRGLCRCVHGTQINLACGFPYPSRASVFYLRIWISIRTFWSGTLYTANPKSFSRIIVDISSYLLTGCQLLQLQHGNLFCRIRDRKDR